MVGDRTQLTDTGRRSRRGGLAWVLLAIAIGGGAVTGWLLWERNKLADDEVAASRARLDDANARAAAAEDQLLALQAQRLRPAGSVPVIDLGPVADELRGALEAQAGEVAVDDDAHRVVVTLDDPDLFRGDDAELTARGLKVIDGLERALAATGDGTLYVDGHVDDAPLPSDGLYSSPWDLSAARALAVVRRLTSDGLPARRLAAVAYGASRPRGGDRQKDRRIEIEVEARAPAQASARSAGARTR